MEAKSVFKVLLVTHYEKNENDNNSNRISWRQNSICQTPVLFLTSIQASDVILRKKKNQRSNGAYMDYYVVIKRTEYGHCVALLSTDIYTIAKKTENKCS